MTWLRWQWYLNGLCSGSGGRSGSSGSGSGSSGTHNARVHACIHSVVTAQSPVSSAHSPQRSIMSDVVWLLVVKGNLRHRIDLLGVEHEYEILNETQRCLRDSVRDIYSLESAQNALSGLEGPSCSCSLNMRNAPRNSLTRRFSFFTVETCLGEC